jgi:hypothetical protein
LKYVSRRALTGKTCLVEAMASADVGLGVLALILTVKRKCKVSGLGPRAGPGPGSTDDVRVRAGFGSGPNDSNQTLYRIFLAFLGHSFFSKKKLLAARDIVGLQKQIQPT